MPLVHVAGLVHAWPQLPQFWSSVWVFTHEPEQLLSVPQPEAPPSGVLVLAVQVPALQTWVLVQAVPQAPQLLLLVWRFTQLLPQAVWPPVQLIWQTPPLQTWLVAQAWPQLPQFWWSPCSLTQVVPQSVSPVVQVVLHTPLVQV